MIWIALAALIVSVAGVGLGLRANAISQAAKDAAKISADEAKKSRLDNLAPSISISRYEPQHTRWMINTTFDIHHFAHPVPVMPSTEFHLPADNPVRVLQGVIVIVVNEGDKTTEIEFGADRLDDITADEANDAVLNPNASTNTINQASTVLPGKVSLSPGETRYLMVRSGPTVGDWSSSGEPPVWSTAIPVTARISVDGAFQQWSLTLSAQIFTTDPRYLGRVRLLPGTLPITNLIHLPHGYP